MMESDDESFYITQDSFRKDVADVDKSDFDPNFLEWVNDDFYEAQDEKKDKSNGIQAKACPSTRKITPVNDEDLKRRLTRDMRLVILVRIQILRVSCEIKSILF